MALRPHPQVFSAHPQGVCGAGDKPATAFMGGVDEGYGSRNIYLFVLFHLCVLLILQL
jgi:hypothetical protein